MLPTFSSGKSAKSLRCLRLLRSARRKLLEVIEGSCAIDMASSRPSEKMDQNKSCFDICWFSYCVFLFHLHHFFCEICFWLFLCGLSDLFWFRWCTFGYWVSLGIVLSLSLDGAVRVPDFDVLDDLSLSVGGFVCLFSRACKLGIPTVFTDISAR